MRSERPTLPRAALLALFALLALGACTPNNYVLLLDNPDGHQSTLTLSNAAGSGTLNAAGQAIGGESGNSRPEPVEVGRNEVARTFGRALAAQPPRPLTFVLNFPLDSTELTPDSQQKLPEILDIIGRRTAPDVSVVGHTDRSGAAAANVELGLRRAMYVRDQVVAIGVDPNVIEVRSYGEFDPMVPTAPGVAEPRNRRVEVTVR